MFGRDLHECKGKPVSEALSCRDPAVPSSALPGGSQDPRRFLNRELSWLAFNERVIEESLNRNNPLFERVRFLSISASNLNEFYMVRVAGLVAQLRAGYQQRSDDGMSPEEQLEAIRKSSARILELQQEVWAILRRELAEEGVVVMRRRELLAEGSDAEQPDAEKLDAEDRAALDAHFLEQIFPVLTPIAIDPAHPFPFIPNLGLSVVLNLREVRTGKILNALVPLPSQLPRFIPVPGPGRRYLTLENLVILFLDRLFPGFRIEGRGVFRIIRDSEVEFEEEADDLVRGIASALERRRRGSVIRLTLSSRMPEELKSFVMQQMKISQRDTFELEGILGLADIRELITDDRPDLLYPPFQPRYPERVESYHGDAFAAIRAKDMIVHHPYESFDVVVQFLRQAARDPDVVSIKQTLYRTSRDSPVVRALVEAAEAGKSVTAVVELKARFDEEANIRWSRDLERAGAQVVFGFFDLKTHAKVSLITRREGGELRSYVHFGTGNYHPVTARIYTDLSLFTCDPALCRDAARLFNMMTGTARPAPFEKLAASPIDLRETLMRLIEEEIGHAAAGRPAGIWAKMNQISDPDIIDALYRASQAGVPITLVCRGICCLRPGVPGLSDRITVKSIVGRFLEHSRIVVFGNGSPLPSPEARVFISSADWMQRNLSWRIETLVPVENPTVHAQVLNEIMVTNLRDDTSSWSLGPDGLYSRLKPGDPAFSAHQYFMDHPSLSGRSTRKRMGDRLPRSFIPRSFPWKRGSA